MVKMGNGRGEREKGERRIVIKFIFHNITQDLCRWSKILMKYIYIYICLTEVQVFSFFYLKILKNEKLTQKFHKKKKEKMAKSNNNKKTPKTQQQKIKLQSHKIFIQGGGAEEQEQEQQPSIFRLLNILNELEGINELEGKKVSQKTYTNFYLFCVFMLCVQSKL